MLVLQLACYDGPVVAIVTMKAHLCDPDNVAVNPVR